jgi:hypothetical protein
MISRPMSEPERRQQFEQLLELALQGEPPPTESGLYSDVVDALMEVAFKRTPESAEAAKAAYELSI